MPGTYNQARLTQRPMPLLVLVSNEAHCDTENGSSQNPLGESFSNNSNDATNATSNDQSADEIESSMEQSAEAQQIRANSLDASTMSSSNLNGSTNDLPNDDHSDQLDEELVTEPNDVQNQSSGEQSIAENSTNQNESIDERAIAQATNVSASTSKSNENNTPAMKPEPEFTPLVQANAQAAEEIFNDCNENDNDSADILAVPINDMPIAG